MKIKTRLFSLLLAMVLIISAVPVNVFAAGTVKQGIAYVNASSLRLRASASTSSKIVDTAYKGEIVVVVSKYGDWYKVIYDLQEGYMHSDYLNVKTTGDAELGYGKINGSNVNLRSGAGTSHKSVAKGNSGDKAYIIGISGGWYKVIFGSNVCYIRSDYLDLTEVPYENRSSSKDPKFFEGGKSTGVTPSAAALNGTSGSTSSGSSSTSNNSSSSSSSNSSSSTNTSASVSGVSGKMYGIGFVDASTLRMRASASTGAKIVDTASRGEVVVVVSKQGDWYKVIYDLKEGYMHGDYLDVSTTENAELGYGKINGSSVNLRSGAGTSHGVVAVSSKGDKAYIIGINNGWYKVIYGQKICYIRSDYLTLTETPYENKSSSNSPKFFRGGESTGVTPSASALNGSTGSSSGSGSSSSGSSSSSSIVTGDQIVATAKKYLGVPYVWGGASPSGFDCSGFVYYVYNSLGIKISRTQASMYSKGTPIDKSELQPGDIVFFQNTYKSGISHCGIYVGDGKFIHSPNSGEVVSYANLYSDYYINHYYGACRYA